MDKIIYVDVQAGNVTLANKVAVSVPEGDSLIKAAKLVRKNIHSEYQLNCPIPELSWIVYDGEFIPVGFDQITGDIIPSKEIYTFVAHSENAILYREL